MAFKIDAFDPSEKFGTHSTNTDMGHLNKWKRSH